MKGKLCVLIGILTGILFSADSYSQQIASGTYNFANSVTPITVNLFPAGTITVKGLGGAITALNTYGVQTAGTVTFTFPDDYLETATSQYSLGGSGSPLFNYEYNEIIFKHTGTGKKPLIIGSTTGTGNVDYIIRLLGADKITFDGIDLAENDSNTTTNSQNEFGYYLLNSGGNGAANNTITNCKITLYNYGGIANQQNINTIGIYTINTSPLANNSGNVFSYDTIVQSYNGILLRGNSSSPDIGNVINNCVIGSSTIGSIGATVAQSSGSDVLGMQASYQNGFSIHDNIIQGCQYYRTGTTSLCYGAWLINISGTNSFYNNQVINIINQRVAAAPTSPGAGLQVEGLPGDSIDIYNNFIGNIQTVGVTSSYFMLFGIRLGGSGGTVNLFHNSVYIPNIGGSQLPSSAALYVTDNSNLTLTAKDNILKNAAQTSGTSKVYSFYFGIGNVLAGSDYNILDVNSGSPSGIYFTGNYLGANKQTFANWQSTGFDANSHLINASFSTISSPVLGITSYNTNYQGVWISSPFVSITKDIFDSTRIYPVIGAYEPNFLSMQVIITANHPGDSLISLGTTQQLLAGVALTVRGFSNKLSGITFNLSGAFNPGTLAPRDFDSIKLWYSTTNSISGATLLNSLAYGDSTLMPASGNNLVFTGLSQTLPLGTNYLFVTFNVLTGATPGHNIRVGTLDSTKITLLSGTYKIMSPDNPLVQGGLQTIAQYYYNFPNSDITLTSSWYATVGMGGNPPNFLNNNQVFVFTANTGNTMGSESGASSWTVGGTNTRIDVGDIYNPPLHAVTFVAKLPVYTLGSVVMNVRDSGTVKFQSAYIPTKLGTLDQGTATTSGSTVEYGDTTITTTADTIKSANYCNLILSGLNTGTRTFPPNVNIARTFDPGGFTAPTPLKGTITFNGAAKQQVIPSGFTFRGLKINNTNVNATLLAGNIAVDSMLTVNSNLTIAAGQTINLNTNALVSLTDTLLINGSLTVNNPSSSVFSGATTSFVQFGNASNYNLSAGLSGTNGGQIPAATWAANSTINITNVTATSATNPVVAGAPSPSGFGNINFDAPALSATPYYLFGGFNYNGGGSGGNPYLVTMQGNLTLGRTNGKTVNLTNSGSGMLIFVGGNVTQRAGTYQLNDNNGRKSLSITGKDSINGNYVYTPSTGYSAPVFYISGVNGSGGVGNLSVGGDFIMLGSSTLTKTNSNTGLANLIFNGSSGNQNATFTNLAGGDINFEINKSQVGGGNDTVKLLSTVVADSFKLTKGVFSIGTNTLTINAGVVYPNPTVGGYTGTVCAAYGAGTGTLAGSLNSNLTIGDANHLVVAGTLKFADNTIGSPNNNYLRNFVLYGNATASLGNALNIAAGTNASPGSITVGNTGTGLTTGGFLTLKSDANGTARVSQNISSANYISGAVTIERYIQTGYRAWRLLTAPIGSAQTIKDAWQEGVTNTSTSGPGQFNPNPGYGTEITNTLSTPASTGYDKAVTNNPSLMYLKNATAWAAPDNTNSTNVNSQQGFLIFVRGDRSVVVTTPPFNPTTSTILRPKGTLKQGNQTVSIPATPAGINYQVVGNPYASEITLDNIFATQSAAIGTNYVMWDPAIGGSSGVGAYVYAGYISPGVYSSFNAHVTNFTPGRIQSGQAFFFDAKAGASCTFKESDKTQYAGPLVFRPVSNSIQSFSTILYGVNADGSTDMDDGTLNLFGSQYSDSVNWLEDAQKIPNPAESLALLENGKLIAINKTQPININDTIFYSLQHMKQQTYRFSFIPYGLMVPDGVVAILQDAFSNTSSFISLTDTTHIDFTVTDNPASQGNSRFRIVFQSPSGGPLPVTYTSIKALQPNTASNHILVEWNVVNQSAIRQYVVERSSDGNFFLDATFVPATATTNASYNWTDLNGMNGENYYRVRSIGSNGEITYSQVVKIKIGAALIPEITVYPNPVKAGVAGLQFSNEPMGNYLVRLLNNVGQQVSNETIFHNGGSSYRPVQLGALAKGIYQLEIINPDNTKSNISILVQ